MCYDGAQRLQGRGDCSSEWEVGWSNCDDGPVDAVGLSSRKPGFSLGAGSGSAGVTSAWTIGCDEEEGWERDKGEGCVSDVLEEEKEDEEG